MSLRILPFLAIAVVTVGSPASRSATAQQPAPAGLLDTLDGSDLDNEPQPSTPEKKQPASKPAASKPSVPRLVGADGKSVVLPSEATLQEFLTWLQERNGPSYAVNSVTVEGTADDKRAELTATIIVQLRNDRQWVRIPIFLNEAQLSATRHTFLGSSLEPTEKAANSSKSDAAAFYSDVTQEAGYRWWFRGKGYHRLTISLVVPVTKSVAQRRLRLKLPPLAAASTVSVRVDDIVVPPEGSKTSVTRAGKSSILGIVGVGSELDLQWRTVAHDRNRAPMLQAQTSVVVDFTEESVELTALQRVQVLNGSVSRVEVQLPAGYQAEATGKFVKNYQIDGRNRATVEFSEARSEWTEIHWTLRRRFPAAGGNVTLDGFRVDRAKVQSGELAIVKVQGLRVEKPDENNVAVSRIRAASFSAPSLIREKALAGVYRFVAQPFRLNLRVTRVQPQLVIDPTVRLHVSASKMELNATFQVEVSDEGGTVRDLEIHWPGWRGDGWKIQPLTATSLIERRMLNAKNDAAPIRLRLTGRRGGRFEIPLLAERTIAPSKDGVAFRLPVLTAAASRQANAGATTLVVVGEPNLTLDLTDREDQPLTQAGNADENDRLTRRYSVADPSSARLTARIKTHPQRLQATAAVTLDPRPFGLYSRQTISLQVEYVPLHTVRFEVPDKAATRVEFFDADGRPLVAQATVSKTGKSLLELRLDRPRLGNVQFVAVTMLELPKALASGESTSLTVPLIRLQGVTFSRVRVHAPADAGVAVELPAGDWRRIPTLDSAPAWSGDAAATSFRVLLTSPDVPRSRPYSVPRGLVRVSVDSAGAAKYRAQYQVSGAPDGVVVLLPPRAGLEAVYWDRQRLSGLRYAENAGGPLRVPAPSPATSRSGYRLLTIDYHVAGQSSPWMPEHRLAAPRFPENVWVEEIAWQVILPRDQHLSSFTSAYLPEFSWDRDTAVWMRQPTDEFADTDAWIGAANGPARPAPTDGNSYVFRRYGAAEDLSVRSMSRPLIVLIGAGLAWLMGILLVKLPRLRTLAVLLTAALGAAVAGLWFPTELKLLLQPALLGAALALGIVGIDRLTRSRNAPAVMAMAHPSDFVTGSRSSVPVRPVASPMPGSEDPTSIRPPAVPPGREPAFGAEPSSTASEARRQG